jgi:ferredoxin
VVSAVGQVRIRVDQDECVSAGRCIAEAPLLFRFDADELSEVIPGQEEVLDEAMAIRIARVCPNRAIVVERPDGTRVGLD